LRSTVVLIVLTFVVLGLLLGYAASYDAATNARVLQLTTDKPEYNRGETVTFTARNLGSERLVFPDSALGIEIKNIDTGTSYSIIAAQVLMAIDLGQSRQIVWQDAADAEAGTYLASIRTAGGSSPSAAAEVEFRII
jgi:hypothetical protein